MSFDHIALLRIRKQRAIALAYQVRAEVNGGHSDGR